MHDEIKLSELEDALATLSYPLEHDEAESRLGGTTLALADGEVDLGDVVAASNDDRYGSADELANEVRANLPREAVGEPYQSEGEG